MGRSHTEEIDYFRKEIKRFFCNGEIDSASTYLLVCNNLPQRPSKKPLIEGGYFVFENVSPPAAGRLRK